MFRRTCHLTLTGLLTLSFMVSPSLAWAQPTPARPNPAPARPASGTPNAAPAQPAQPVPGARNPARQHGIQLSIFNPMAPQTMTQYMPMPYPYPMPMPSYGSGMAGYGGQGAGHQAYGGQGAGYQGNAGGAVPAVLPEEKSLDRVLTASGVPNDNGSLRWPLGLRVVGGSAADDLRQQVQALFQLAAQQAQAGSIDPALAQELARSVDRLRRLLLRDRDERFSLALTSYEESEHFLAKLDHAQKVLRAGLEPSGGQAQLKARQANANEVGLYDNRFDPPTLTVPAGTTVRWTNHGQHKHTVTSDEGDWGSEGLAPGGAYSYTFTSPGEYPYHCEVHPGQMRGTVVVK